MAKATRLVCPCREMYSEHKHNTCYVYDSELLKGNTIILEYTLSISVNDHSGPTYIYSINTEKNHIIKHTD